MNEIRREERLIESDKLKTEIAKDKFIDEIRNGLGEQIKQNAGVVKKKELGFFARLFRRIMDTF
jgi:hypothetical protein